VGKLWRGIDIREFGSGNIGASNILRTLGPGPAIVVFVGDTLKGLLAVLLCRGMHLSDGGIVLGGLAAVVGHSWSLFLRGAGGRGVATSLGMLIGLDWRVAAIGFGSWAVVVGLTRYISVASLVAVGVAAVMMTFLSPHRIAFVLVTWLAAAFIWWRHIPNIRRLRTGTEFKLGQKVATTDKASACGGAER
jgi:glycerol-3-phosphate acyltransferase PlsY